MPPILMRLLRLGPTNPIAVRLVSTGSRRQRHLYIRAGYLAAMIIALLWLMLFSGGSGALSYGALAREGARTFEWIAYLQIALICILAPVFMAGAIAQEADPRTWDIQLTTPLTSGEIVVGNLLGRLFFILALLASSLPLFALTQYFGGVPGRSILASYAVAAGAAFLVGAIAIALSVSRLAGKRAVFAFYVAVVTYLATTIGIDAFLRQSGQSVVVNGSAGVTVVTALNPFLALSALLNPSQYPRAPEGSVSGLMRWLLQTPVTTWSLGSFALGTLLILASTLTVRTGGLAGVLEGRGVANWFRRRLGLATAGADHRPPRAVGHNPIAWREASARNATLGRIVARWSFIALGLATGVVIVLAFHTKTIDHATYDLVLATVLGAEVGVIALVAINMSATAVSREREDGTLDLLLTTPITPGQYLSGKLRGLVAYLLPMAVVPIATLALAGVHALVLTDPVKEATITGSVLARVVLPEAGLVLAMVLVPFIALCVMIGLQWSLKSKGTLSAVVATVGVVGVVAGVVGLCGFSAGRDLPLVGPVLSALSPASAIWATLHPIDAMLASIDDGASGALATAGARVALLIGAAVAAGVYSLMIVGLHSAMVRTFDVTVRKLAGQR